jgi:hypothetical protein
MRLFITALACLLSFSVIGQTGGGDTYFSNLIEFPPLTPAGSSSTSEVLAMPLFVDSTCQLVLNNPSLVIQFDTIYNWACGGTWNGAPVDSSNGPSDVQRQLAMDLNFYESDSNIYYMEIANLITGNGIWVLGGCFEGFTLTGIELFAQGVEQIDMDVARSGQNLCTGSCEAPIPLCNLLGWESEITDQGISINTENCPDYGLVNFSSITGSIRIRNGLLIRIQTSDTFQLESLQSSITFGCEQQIIYPTSKTHYGCGDPNACNFNQNDTPNNELCDYTCCPGPGCCDQGTVWNIESQTCIVLYPADLNFDSCVDLNDLMDLLSDYGNCLDPE